MRDIARVDAEIAEKKKELLQVVGTPTEVYTRIVGYYRPLKNWNPGKMSEYKDRKVFAK